MKELKHTGGNCVGPLSLSANVAKKKKKGGEGWGGVEKTKQLTSGLLCPCTGVALPPATGAILEDRHSRHGYSGQGALLPGKGHCQVEP